MGVLVKSLMISLLLTEALELPFCILAWRFRGREIIICALVNIVTNPPVVLAHYYIKRSLAASGGLKYLPLVIIGLELAAVIVEWLFYRRCTDKKHPFFVSLTANAFSYLTGLALSLIL